MQAVSKHRNKPVTIDNIRFQSKREAARYQELKLLLREGMITDLELQPRFDLIINHVKVCTYIADFRYTTSRKEIVIEDVKSEFTRKNAVYRLKSKLLKAIYGISITEVY